MLWSTTGASSFASSRGGSRWLQGGESEENVWCYLADMEARMEVVRTGGEHESMLRP